MENIISIQNHRDLIILLTLIVGFDAFSSNHRACLRAAICEIIMLSFTKKKSILQLSFRNLTEDCIEVLKTD